LTWVSEKVSYQTIKVRGTTWEQYSIHLFIHSANFLSTRQWENIKEHDKSLPCGSYRPVGKGNGSISEVGCKGIP
jgi:hypothetical protein